MGEKEPKPKLTDVCGNCEKRYALTEQNALLFIFNKQPDCNHLQAECPSCGNNTLIYLQDGGDTKDKALKHGINVIEVDYAPKHIYKQFLELAGITLIEPHDLTPRQEHHVEYLGWLLSHELLEPETFEGEGELSI
jgi:hypothetical protein